ncbi:putative nucleotide-binding protein (sugar kinase/HSP70/actin superfamily) [Bacilli bacterium PM5-3]|nr:putative nucleotide-binding protein (sugar kinase/HSP70/actin superfamily) [Bacilli bacterium PM5-3]
MEERVIFTEEMKKEYTILIPQMAPFHFDLLSSTLNSFGYKSKVLKNQGANLAYEGNKYVHNDTCVPAIYVIGQFLDAIKSGEYDVNKIALIITQTGGGCRASNYIHLLRSALKKAGYGFIPVISLNASNIESNPGFNLSIPLLKKLVQSITIGDLIMQLHNETKPYEVNENETDELSEKWLRYLEKEYENKTIISNHKMYSYLRDMVADYEKIPTKDIKKPKVGIVGEIYVKYSPVGNNNLEKFLIDEGCEVVTPGIMDFLLYTFESTCYDIKQYGGSKLKSIIFKILAKYMEKPRAKVNSILKNTKYRQMISFKELRQLALPFIGYGTHVGEGWLLTAEIIELINSDVTNVITTQPFGCLPNHIVARGMFKSIKEAFPYANLTSIDFDTSSSAINQQNRIKLLVMNAKEKLDD